MRTKPTLLALAALTAMTLTSCAATTPAAAPTPTEAEVSHGYVEGAVEAVEPQLHLATIDATGELGLLDLLTEEAAVLAGEATIGDLTGTTSISTDGRYVFASNATSGALSIVDTGVWTVDHEDHSHYYRATPAAVGVLEGTGEATVHTAGTLTGVWFAESGEGVVLDHEALGDGDIVELARIDGEPHAGALVPFGGKVIATDSTSSSLQVYTADGEAVDGATAACEAYSGTITTSVGAAFGCADGAVLATSGPAESVVFERIAFPDGADSTGSASAGAVPATDFGARKGRPSVAALADSTGAWLLDTRERSWTLLPSDVPLLQVDAADDRDGNVVALAADGRILVLDPATGATVAATEPLLAATIAEPSLLAGVELTVDTNRAYINAVAEGIVYEIDYADGARIARQFAMPSTPLFLAETGR